MVMGSIDDNIMDSKTKGREGGGLSHKKDQLKGMMRELFSAAEKDGEDMNDVFQGFSGVLRSVGAEKGIDLAGTSAEQQVTQAPNGDVFTDEDTAKTFIHRDLSCYDGDPPEAQHVSKFGKFKRNFKSCSDGGEDFRKIATHFVVIISLFAAKRPIQTILTVLTLTIGIFFTGLNTNFRIEDDPFIPFTPAGSRSSIHWTWIDEWNQNRTKEQPGITTFNMQFGIHASKNNILNMEGLDRANQVIDVIKSSYYWDQIGFDDVKCVFGGLTQTNGILWNDTTAPQTNEELLQILNDETWELADMATIIGGIERDETGQIITGTSLAYTVMFQYPDGNQPIMDKLEADIADLLETEIIGIWFTPYQLNYITDNTLVNGLNENIHADGPKVIFVFVIMTCFTAAVFFRCDRVESRSSLGLCGVLTITCSMATGFGLMFCIGVPFAPMTLIVPFLMFGVGLDDTFVIVGEYHSTDEELDILDRVHETMEECAVSVITTTLTTTMSFALGTMTTIPAIKWVCLYAGPSVFIDFFYQITMFIAFLVLDDRRSRANRIDCFVCCKVEKPKEDVVESKKSHIPQKNAVGIFMESYADFLMKPWVRKSVLTGFISGFLYLTWRAYGIKIDFRPAEMMMPPGSPAIGFFSFTNEYFDRGVGVDIYFRDCDQEDDAIQDKMIAYLEEIRNLDNFGEDSPPMYCWIIAYREMLAKLPPPYQAVVKDMPFRGVLDMAKAQTPVYYDYFEQFLNLNTNFKEGKITSSKCKIFAEVDLLDSPDQMKLWTEVQNVEKNTEMNIGRSAEDMRFIAYQYEFTSIWELYDKVLSELMSTLIATFAAVMFVGFIIIPHWSGIFFVVPVMVMLIIDLLGIMEVYNYSINPVSFIALIIAMGLMVDYVIHVLIRYYESLFVTRIEKVKDTLETTGESVLIGGLSTLLGFLPLLFTQSQFLEVIAYTIFTMVVFALLHGLVFMPVLLSYLGPVDTHVASKGKAIV